MAENTEKPQQMAPTEARPSPAAEARGIVRRALTAALATLEPGGHPYASLVLVACASDGTPLLLLSRLARHTRNFLGDARASILFDGTARTANPLEGGRVTLIGRMLQCEDEAAARARFVSRHPESTGYADFADFNFYRLAVERAHYVGGFGRIVELAAADVTIPTDGAPALLAAEPEILAHMNADHADAVQLYATALARAPAGAWRMCGIDPDGIDLVADGRSARIAFAGRITTPGQARTALADLARAARASSQK